MPIPRHSVALPSVQLAAQPESGGVTELRVHGVGGSPPDAILGDLAPEQVIGDAIAGFYRSSDHRAGDEDRVACRDVDRHVEVFSWGGLTSRARSGCCGWPCCRSCSPTWRGWMCPARTRASAWRFRLHRLAAGLCALALTVNAALIAVMISADVNAYQTSRAGIAGHQWWLAPLGWHFVAGHPARQVTARGAGGGAVRAGAGLAGQQVVALRGGAAAVPGGGRPGRPRPGRPRRTRSPGDWPTRNSGTARAASACSPGCTSPWSAGSWRSCSASRSGRWPADRRTPAPWDGRG